jgi:4-amino-4-deoxy-L-arabinose transferase-like glycosyltransferase
MQFAPNSAIIKLRIGKFSNLQIFLLLFITTLIFRLPSLINTLVGVDEATYLMAGKELFSGKVFLIDIWDFKPIGIFLIDGMIAKTLPYPLFMTRLLAIIFVCFTGFFLYKAKAKFASKEIAVLTGVAYVVITSLLRTGIDTNTEVFFNMFTAASLFFILQNNKFAYILSGLFFGLGFFIKYVTAFDYLTFVSFFVIASNFIEKKKPLAIFINGMFIFIGFMIPAIIMCVYFISNHAWTEFIATLTETKNVYSSSISITRELAFIGDFIISYLPFIVAFAISIAMCMKQKKSQTFIALFALIWLLSAWVAIILQGKHFVHYYIQALLPLSFFMADFFFLQQENKAWRIWKRIIFYLFIIVVCASVFEQYRIIKRNYKTYKLTNYLENIIKPNDSILTSNSRIYYELNKIPASKFFHASILFSPEHIDASGINIELEYVKIFNGKPQFVILEEKEINNKIKPYLMESYSHLKTIEGYYIYMRK